MRNLKLALIFVLVAAVAATVAAQDMQADRATTVSEKFRAPLPATANNARRTTPSLPQGGPQEVRGQWEKISGADWIRQALALENLTREFDSLEERRGRLLEQIDESKAGYQPGVLDPANVLKRRQIDRQLGQMQQVIQRARVIELQAGWTLAAVRRSHDQVRRAMEEAQSLKDGAADKATLDRLQTRWSEALEAAKNKQPEKYASALLGEALGPLALRTQSRGDELLPEEVPVAAASMGEIGTEIRRRWIQRQQQVDQLDIRQKELQRKVQEQELEINALKMELNRLRENFEHQATKSQP